MLPKAAETSKAPATPRSGQDQEATAVGNNEQVFAICSNGHGQLTHNNPYDLVALGIFETFEDEVAFEFLASCGHGGVGYFEAYRR